VAIGAGTNTSIVHRDDASRERAGPLGAMVAFVSRHLACKLDEAGFHVRRPSPLDPPVPILAILAGLFAHVDIANRL
jgi:hypothetical protein